MNFEAVIGLEVHAQLLTQSKLFCGCSASFGATPNAHTCEICLGMPGVLPVLNRRAVELVVRAGLALGATINTRSQWSRKNYFYADLPKGYQISQYDQPIVSGGSLLIEGEQGERRIALTRIHLEEDAGKNIHDEVVAGNRSVVDFNRGGVALAEIVSEPQLHSAQEAADYLKKLRQLLRYLDVCDGNMEEGSLRCDVNISLRKAGSVALGTRVELKNINSFKFIQQAIDFEIARQCAVLESGAQVVQETRLWDPAAKVTRTMRSKEDAHDYRYFPDPDLPDLHLDESWIQSLAGALPELPAAKRDRYVSALGLSDYDAAVLTEDRDLATFFESAVAVHKNYKAVANWTVNELLREAKGQALSTLKIQGSQLGELVALIDDDTISGKIAKDVFAQMVASGESPRLIVEQKGLRQVTDTSSIEQAIDDVLQKNPDSVAAYKAGKDKLMGFFVGQVMKTTGGKANPKIVNELLRKKLQ